jgi:two-component sensor histidine kinase
MNIDIDRRKRAEEHETILSAELRHRVRNIIAIINTISTRTAQSVQSVEEYAGVLSDRLMALARTQALLTRATSGGVDVAMIVRDEVSAQGHSDGEYEINGPEVWIAAKAAEVLGLAIHELATNALKHGALSQPSGRVSVSWRVMPRDGERWLIFQWSENPAHPMKQVEPARRGFGTELIERRIPYELRGVGQLTIDAKGAQCTIEFPLRPGTSVLQTDAPVTLVETHR